FSTRSEPARYLATTAARNPLDCTLWRHNHAMESIEAARRAAAWAHHPLDATAAELLEAYAIWLEAEAIPAGGLGPREADRIWSRHLADSILFAAGWPEAPPDEILDVGSGVGLPGIPLGILWPDAEITLLDRGGRRIRLLDRVVRVLGLDNVHISQGDVFDVADEWSGVVYRGSVKASESVGLSARLLEIPGTAVLGLSRRAEPPDRTRDLVGVAQAMGLDAEIVGVPPEILDAPAWLLIMRAGE
ncbi:MAG: RsmG family class I SAM-dependent methyltransferase, partial [Acidimicrobiia bacterium]